MAKIERLHERELRAEQQAQAVAERSAQKRKPTKNENVRMPTHACTAGVGRTLWL